MTVPDARVQLAEWREIGTTGSTDGHYGDGGDCKRRTLSDLGWLVERWGVDAAKVSALVDGAIECGRLSERMLVSLLSLEQVAAIARPMLSTGAVRKVLASNCATGSLQTKKTRQAEMLSALQARGFGVQGAGGEALAVRALLSAHQAARDEAERKRQQAAARRAEELRRVHPGRLERHEADLSGLDSVELRHVEQWFERWSCCGKRPGASGCREPAHAQLS